MMRSILVGILVLMAAGIGWLTFDWYRGHYGGEPFGAAFTLVDQKGAPITEAAFRGQPSVVFFGFTHCPEVCPTTLFELAGWLKTLGDDGKNLHAYFVSVDPERDTPEVMNTYVSNFSDRIVGITGDPDKVHAMAKSFGIYWKKVDTGDGDYTMDHTASVLLLNAKGDFAGTIAYGESPDTAIAKLKRLAAKATDPWDRDDVQYMTQTRLHFITGKIEAIRIFAALEAAFEDEGLPIAVLEVDEDRDIHEVSLYADGDVDAVEARLKDILAGLSLSKPIEREALPDIDWVARSLEGLEAGARRPFLRPRRA